MFRIFLVSTTVSLITVSAAFAEDNKNNPKIVVTANRIAQNKDKIGSSITVIDREQIEKSGTSQVYDLIKLAPGVTVTRSGGIGSDSNIFIRGSNPGQVRVMIDGVYMNDPSSAFSEYDFNSLLINDIERIEVLRGPQSALYGSDAMGGVVNIITRKGVGKAKFNALVETGSYKTFRQAAGVNGAHGRVDYSLQLQNFKTGGISRLTNTAEKDGTSNKTMNGRVGVQATDNLSFDLSGNYSDLSSDYDMFGADGENNLEKKTFSGAASSTIKTLDGIWDHKITLQGAKTKRDFDEPLSTATRFSTYDGIQTTAEYQSNIKLRALDILTVGAISEKQEATTSATSNLGVYSKDVDRDFRTNSLYGQYLLSLTENTTLTAGGRRDDHSAFGNYNTYRATIAQEIPYSGTILRASYGTGFKSPNLFQLFHPIYGASNLQPEESKGYDAGIEQKLLASRLTLGFTAFQNEYENLIDYNFSTSKYNNLPRANTKGTESTASFSLTPELTFRSSHTFLLTEDKATRRSLQRRPKHTFINGVDYEVLGKGKIGMDIRYISQQWDSPFSNDILKSFTTADLHAGYEITPQVELYTRLENIFDKKYEEVKTFNAAGFSAYVGLKANYY